MTVHVHPEATQTCTVEQSSLSYKINEQPAVDKQQTSTQRCFQLCVCELRAVRPPDGLRCSLLAKCGPKAANKDLDERGHFWCGSSCRTFCAQCDFKLPAPFSSPDNKHSSDRQQQAGRRPCAILVRHTLLLQASWTKSFLTGPRVWPGAVTCGTHWINTKHNFIFLIIISYR